MKLIDDSTIHNTTTNNRKGTTMTIDIQQRPTSKTIFSALTILAVVALLGLPARGQEEGSESQDSASQSENTSSREEVSRVGVAAPTVLLPVTPELPATEVPAEETAASTLLRYDTGRFSDLTLLRVDPALEGVQDEPESEEEQPTETGGRPDIRRGGGETSTNRGRNRGGDTNNGPSVVDGGENAPGTLDQGGGENGPGTLDQGGGENGPSILDSPGPTINRPQRPDPGILLDDARIARQEVVAGATRLLQEAGDGSTYVSPYSSPRNADYELGARQGLINNLAIAFYDVNHGNPPMEGQAVGGDKGPGDQGDDEVGGNGPDRPGIILGDDDSTRTRTRDRCVKVLRFRDFDFNIRYDDSALEYRVVPHRGVDTTTTATGNSSTTTDGTNVNAGATVTGTSGPVTVTGGASASRTTQDTNSSSSQNQTTITRAYTRYDVTVTGSVRIWSEYTFHEIWMWEGECPGVVNPRSDATYTVKSDETTSQVNNSYSFRVYESHPNYTSINNTVVIQNARYRFQQMVNDGNWSTDHVPRPSASELPSPQQVGVE
jgi:hypothetical protein